MSIVKNIPGQAARHLHQFSAQQSDDPGTSGVRRQRKKSPKNSCELYSTVMPKELSNGEARVVDATAREAD
jgi:hypothetical protein